MAAAAPFIAKAAAAGVSGLITALMVPEGTVIQGFPEEDVTGAFTNVGREIVAELNAARAQRDQPIDTPGALDVGAFVGDMQVAGLPTGTIGISQAALDPSRTGGFRGNRTDPTLQPPQRNPPLPRTPRVPPTEGPREGPGPSPQGGPTPSPTGAQNVFASDEDRQKSLTDIAGVIKKLTDFQSGVGPRPGAV